jgi:hypothetical protein
MPVNIREYSTMGQVIGHAPMAMEPPVARQSVNVTGGSAASAAFQQGTRYVRLNNDSATACRVEFGQNPTADALSARLAANQTEYFAVPEGGGFSVAVISSA